MMTGVLKNIAAKITAALKIFLGTDKPKELKNKAKRLIVLVPSFRIFDWLMVIAGGAITITLKEYGFSNPHIFLLLWTGYAIQSRVEIFVNDKFEQDDITLMEGLRRWINACFELSSFWGVVAEIISFIRVIIWDGIGCMAILYRSSLPPSKFLRIILLILFAGIHIAIWFQLYLMGYDSAFSFLKCKFLETF